MNNNNRKLSQEKLLTKITKGKITNGSKIPSKEDVENFFTHHEKRNKVVSNVNLSEDCFGGTPTIKKARMELHSQGNEHEEIEVKKTPSVIPRNVKNVQVSRQEEESDEEIEVKKTSSVTSRNQRSLCLIREESENEEIAVKRSSRKHLEGEYEKKGIIKTSRLKAKRELELRSNPKKKFTRQSLSPCV